jgi:DNA-binding MarR family transcriptional regulator
VAVASQRPDQLPDLVCACATIRRAARLVTQFYGQEMGGQIEPTQFTLLMAMSQHPGLNQTQLGSALGLDKTTMSRNLRVMNRQDWVQQTRTADGRESGYTITPAGSKKLAAAKPAWSRAQAKLQSNLKSLDWQNMLKTINQVSAAAGHAATEYR